MVLSCFDAVSECLIGHFFFDTRSSKNRDKSRLRFETQIKSRKCPTFVVQMISYFLIIVVQQSNAHGKGDLWGKLEWLGWVFHTIHPALKLKTQQHAKTHHAKGGQNDRQRHTVAKDVSFPRWIVCLDPSSYFTRLIITL